jgi:endonuclease-3
MNKKKVDEIIETLEGLYPDAVCELDFKTTYQLLVATVLSAQTTDKKVNESTKQLFEAAGTPEAMIMLEVSEIKSYIKTLGLSNSKAGYVHALSIKLLEEFDGHVPSEMEALTSLPGVGRKTANVVLSVGFNIPAMAVDTHVKRLANRLGFSDTQDVVVIEKDLKKAIPKSKWNIAHHLLIFHGRRLCKARHPGCNYCPLTHLCYYYKVTNKKV